MNKNDTVKTGVKTGIGFGSALAMVISYANWHSIICGKLIPKERLRAVPHATLCIEAKQNKH